MIKILATTDMSANSRSGMRYAILLAAQLKAEITFIHVHMVLRASTWTDAVYRHYIEEEKMVLEHDLHDFIRSVYHSVRMVDPVYHMVIRHTFDISDTIMDFAKKEGINYICISARGGGKLVKLFGSVTGSLISGSDVPVICVPEDDRSKTVSKVLYASDMTAYESELNEVISFARPLDATVEMLHLSYPFEPGADVALTIQELKSKFRYPVEFLYQKRDVEESVLHDIELAVKKSKPSVIAMFTRRRESFFEKWFIGSKSRDYSFRVKVPLLVFPKKD